MRVCERERCSANNALRRRGHLTRSEGFVKAGKLGDFTSFRRFLWRTGEQRPPVNSRQRTPGRSSDLIGSAAPPSRGGRGAGGGAGGAVVVRGREAGTGRQLHERA